MNMRLPLIVTAALIALMLAASLWTWSVLPANAVIPIHWDINGRPNSFAGKNVGLFLAPGIVIIVSALFAAVPALEPRRGNLLRSAKFYRATWIVTILLLAVMHAISLAAALSYRVNVDAIAIGSVGAMFMVIGNYLGKSRSMFFGGVRTPWTLSSEYSWQRTNRIAGRLLILAGGAALVALLLAGARLASFVLIGSLAFAIVLSVVMSYLFWRRDPDRASGELAQP